MWRRHLPLTERRRQSMEGRQSPSLHLWEQVLPITRSASELFRAEKSGDRLLSVLYSCLTEDFLLFYFFLN